MSKQEFKSKSFVTCLHVHIYRVLVESIYWILIKIKKCNFLI